ncbi:hypothetical protein FACS1894170_12150 [Planctomycetales bacterium]|nr:hypothetical protein FACS1894170_12150 [Planctomycetales bacterium]
MKNETLMNADDVCRHFDFSLLTLKRKVQQAREGKHDFPLPIMPKRCRLLWRRADIENYTCQTQIIEPVKLPTMTSPAMRKRQAEAVAKELERFGITTANKMNPGTKGTGERRQK